MVSDVSGNTAKVYRYVDIIDTLKPVLTLIGISPDTIEVYTSYKDRGVKTSDNYYTSKQLDPRVTVANLVDTSKLGIYTVTYNLKDSSGNQAIPVVRTVVVVDTVRPVIVLNGPKTDSMSVFTIYNDPGVTVSDNYDKVSNIAIAISGTFYTNFHTGTEATVLGSYTIIYTATDKSGNKSSVMRTVLVRDWTPPVIKLKGTIDTSVCRWSNYADQVYTLSDNYDNKININVDTIGTFVTNGGTSAVFCPSSSSGGSFATAFPTSTGTPRNTWSMSIPDHSARHRQQNAHEGDLSKSTAVEVIALLKTGLVGLTTDGPPNKKETQDAS